jgi:HPt (histidine-containing phosphotransfer) domain-containing protein
MVEQADREGIHEQILGIVGDGSPTEQALAVRILGGFAEKAGRLLGELAAAPSDRAAEHAAHALRGAAALVGYRSLAELAAQAEDLAGSGDAAASRALLDRLALLVDAWPDALGAAIETLPPDARLAGLPGSSQELPRQR